MKLSRVIEGMGAGIESILHKSSNSKNRHIASHYRFGVQTARGLACAAEWETIDGFRKAAHTSSKAGVGHRFSPQYLQGDSSMVFRKTIFALAVLACLLTGKAVAADYYVDITNQTGFTIVYVYVSPGDARSWEEDVLGTDVLPDDMTQRVTLGNYNSPIFDIRLVDEDGDSYTFWNIDTSRHDLVVTLDNLD